MRVRVPPVAFFLNGKRLGDIPVLLISQDKMRVYPTRLMKQLLKDPLSKQQLQKALVDPSQTVTVNGVEYELYSVFYSYGLLLSNFTKR